MNILELQGITRAFGGIVAADRVDLALEDGELHCLIGPNGAGKSTLFKLVMGLIKPQAGRIGFNGQDITKKQPYERVHLGLAMKYQATRVFTGLTVAQNVTIASSRVGNDQDLLHWALARFNLCEKSALLAGNLSYGEQHWLEMCMALGNGPKVVLMDEPTAGMTPEETAETAHFLKELNARSVTVVVIEHDMGFVRLVARRITVLHQGRVFRQGSLQEVENDTDVQRIYLGESHA